MKKSGQQMTVPGLPGRQQAHIWLLDLDRQDPESFQGDCFVLDDSEQERAAVFRRERDRQQYRLTRTAVRNVLSNYYPTTAPAQWRFARGVHGKPAIAGPKLDRPLYFNISHSGQWVAIAVAQNECIGIDLERITARQSMMAIARRYFTNREFSELGDLAPEMMLRRFYELWTLKEAYSKACGNALVPTLKELELNFPEQKEIGADLRSAGGKGKALVGWCLRLFELGDYQLALAMRDGHESGSIDTMAWQLDDPLEPGAATEFSLSPCRWNR